MGVHHCQRSIKVCCTDTVRTALKNNLNKLSVETNGLTLSLFLDLQEMYYLIYSDIKQRVNKQNSKILECSSTIEFYEEWMPNVRALGNFYPQQSTFGSTPLTQACGE